MKNQKTIASIIFGKCFCNKIFDNAAYYTYIEQLSYLFIYIYKREMWIRKNNFTSVFQRLDLSDI